MAKEEIIKKTRYVFGEQLNWGKNKSLKNWNVATFNNGVEIDVKDIAKCMRKHLRFRDWINPYKIIIAAVQAFDILSGPENVKGRYILSDKKKWKFPIYETAYENE